MAISLPDFLPSLFQSKSIHSSGDSNKEGRKAGKEIRTPLYIAGHFIALLHIAFSLA
jgi:hypothetical protein